jgi:hypothetical protein
MAFLKPFRFPTLKEYRNNTKNSGSTWNDTYKEFSCDCCGRFFNPGETSYPVRELYGPVKHYHKNCRPVAEEKP